MQPTICAADGLVLDIEVGGMLMNDGGTVAEAGLIIDGGHPHILQIEGAEGIMEVLLIGWNGAVTVCAGGAAGATRRGKGRARRCE